MSDGADKHYDIVIAGGGMVGSSLALALAPLDLDIALVEPVPRAVADQPSFDDRSTALSRSTQRMFEALEIWDEVVRASAPITHVHVSDRGRFGFAHIDAEEQGVEALGHVVINRVLGQVLQESLSRVANLDILCPAVVLAARGESDAAAVTIGSDGDEQYVTCKLLVAADGANSAVRDMLGIVAQQVSYGQWAVTGNLLTELPMRHRAFERFTPDGPFALLPVSDGRAGFVRVVDGQDVNRVMDLDDDAFLAELQQSFGKRVGAFSRVGKRSAYPLSLSKAVRLTAPRAVVVGNAAHGLHPAAAQGFNLGLRDVAALADCIADGDGDCGSAEVLDRYARWRRSDQKKLVRFTDGLVRLFGDSRPPVPALRDIGMLGFDLVPGARRLFAKHTMGLAGRLPRLSRGVPLA